MLPAVESQTKPILVVEDNGEDYETVLRAFKKVGISNPITRCEDGDEALDYLFRRGRYADAASSPQPGVILLDLNMPGTDGFEVLDEIKRDDELRKIPVVILTTSSSELDIDKSYRAGASSYIQKPVDLEGFIAAIRRFKEYWFDTAFLP